MRRRGRLAAAAVTLIALAGLLGASASGSATPVRYVATCLRSTTSQGNGCESLSITFGIGVAPKKLPRHELTPAALNLRAKFATSDGSHPSALREMTVDLDRNMALDAKGLPVCHPTIETQQQPGAVRKACRTATVGRGKADFEIAFPEQAPLQERSLLTLYNGGVADGETTLYAVASINIPVPQAVVTQIKITKVRKGRYGYEAIARLPVVAGGSGSLVGFNLRIKRRFHYRRRQMSFITARCPDEELKFDFPTLLFRNEAGTPGAASQTIFKGSISTPCMPSSATLPAA